MRTEFEILLTDAPGTLAPVLETFAEHGANVLSVVHRHEAAEDGHVPVVIVVEVAEDAAVALIGAITRTNRIMRVDQEGGPAHTSVLLTGHVFQARLDQILEPVFAAGGEIGRIDARIDGRERPSAVLVDISAESEDALSAAMKVLRRQADEAGLDIIEGLRGSAHA